jgi:very-short-patch-repair endonuclease
MKTNMNRGAASHLFGFARQLRNNQTEAEKLLWEKLRGNQTGYKYRRQHPLINYIVDFYCHALKLVIEVDGDAHLTPAGKMEDADKDDTLVSYGYKILRFTNLHILSNIEDVIQIIRSEMKSLEEQLEEKKWGDE